MQRIVLKVSVLQ